MRGQVLEQIGLVRLVAQQLAAEVVQEAGVAAAEDRGLQHPGLGGHHDAVEEGDRLAVADEVPYLVLRHGLALPLMLVGLVDLDRGRGVVAWLLARRPLEALGRGVPTAPPLAMLLIGGPPGLYRAWAAFEEIQEGDRGLKALALAAVVEPAGTDGRYSASLSRKLYRPTDQSRAQSRYL